MGTPVTTVDPDGHYVKSIPDELVSGTARPRIRVDPGQTGFFEGRIFRAYKEAVVPVAGPSVSIRFTSPSDFILWSQSLELTQGALRFEVFTGATPSGVWTDIPVIGVNRMAGVPQPPYASQVSIQTGGEFTGGNAVDLLLVRTSSQNASAQNAGGSFTERGLPAGSYYLRFSTLTGGLNVNDAAQMIYSIVWEERE